jgi:hypothetical protein
LLHSYVPITFNLPEIGRRVVYFSGVGTGFFGAGR